MLARHWIAAVTLVLAAPLAPALAATVCNAGFPGENSAQLLGRLPQALAACPRATVVVLFVGMNDAVNEKRFLTPEQTFAAVTQTLKGIAAVPARAVVVTAHLPDVTRLMQRHTPESYGSRTPAQRIRETDGALRKAARQEGATVVDFYAVLSKAGGASQELSTDGVHFTAKGYGLLAAAVASTLPGDASNETVLCLGDSLTYGTGVRAADAPDAGSESYPQQLGRLLNGRPR